MGWKIGVISFFSAFLLWWYSNDLKRQPFIGNFVVALLTGLSIFLVNILYHVHQPLVTIYSLFAFAVTLVREIVKDAEDLKGDNTFGCKTLPIIWRISQNKILSLLLTIDFFYFSDGDQSIFCEAADVLFLHLSFYPLVLLVIWLVRAETTKDFHRVSQWCKVIMLLGISSMIFI